MLDMSWTYDVEYVEAVIYAIISHEIEDTEPCLILHGRLSFGAESPGMEWKIIVM